MFDASMSGRALIEFEPKERLYQKDKYFSGVSFNFFEAEFCAAHRQQK
jgi:hypothetical protein